MPTMMAVGVANPKAHGQEITSTATARTIPACQSSRNKPFRSNVKTAITTTRGTNQAETRSTNACTGARDPWACATNRAIPASTVLRPTPVTRQTRTPSPLSVPAKTLSPGCFSIGRGSPVSMASETADPPDKTTPSTGTASPLKIRTCASGWTSVNGTDSN